MKGLHGEIKVKPKQRYDPESKLNKLKEKYQDILTRDGEPWTTEEKDYLLELWLNHGVSRFYPEVPGDCFAVLLGRSHRSVDTAGWKLAARYPGFDYVPETRSDRSHLPITPRDEALLAAVCQPAAVKNGSLRDKTHLANLTGRNPDGVLTWVGNLIESTPSFSCNPGGGMDWRMLSEHLVTLIRSRRTAFVMRLGAPSEYQD